ncbi:MAG: GntR family transcriptional regulator [Acidobacteriaceae bacterium]|jgi:DNA-binding GntR family transcriptional regulator
MLKLTKNPNLTEQAYQSVKQQLLNGSFPEGSKLTEEYLSSALGISKSPVREALMRLESEGLINIEARRGAYVRKFTAKEVRELYDVRALLEVHAVSTARITPQLLEAMAASIERTRANLEAGDKLSHIEEDIHFHGLISRSTGNHEFGRILDNIQQKSLLCRMATFYLSATTAPASHQKIYTAMRDGDVELAKREMHDHILFVRDTLLRSLAHDVELAGDEAEDALVRVRA